MRKLIKDVIKDKKIGSEDVYGWVTARRDLVTHSFFTIKDRSGGLQVVVSSGNPLIESFRSVNIGDVVSVKGDAKEDKRALGGVELLPSELKVIASCHLPTPLPLDHLEHRVSPSLDKRLDSRYLDLRNDSVARIFKIKSEVLKYMRKSFEDHEFIEINTPKIIKEGAEGGTALFPVEYFNRDAFLAQSPQFYKQMLMASGLERVYEIAPAFRAETHNTPRHLNEFTSVDAEMAFISSVEDVMKLSEELVRDTAAGIRNYAEKTGLETEIGLPRLPFPRITFDDAHSLLRDLKVPVEEDEDIRSQGEEALGNHFK